MSLITTDNVSEAIVKVFAANALPILRERLMMGRLVNRNFENMISERGDTVNVPLIPAMTASRISQGGSVTTQSPNLGNVPITLTTHVESSFKIPDVVKAIKGGDIVSKYLAPAIIAVANTIEQDLFNLYADLTANAAVGSAGSNLTEAVVDSAETALFNAKVDESTPRWMAVTAAQYGVLRQLERFSQEDKIGSGDAIITGQVGTLKGFNVFRHHFVPVTSGPDTDHNIAFTPDTFALVMRPLGRPVSNNARVEPVSDNGYGMRIVMTYDGNQLSDQFTVDALYGVATVRPETGVEVLS